MKVKLGKLTHQETKHIVGPALADVFGGNYQEHGKWFIPLLSVDLAEVRPDWAGLVVHFVGYEVDGPVTFQLVDNKYLYEGDYGMCFGETAQPGSWKAEYLELIEAEIPMLSDPEANWDMQWQQLCWEIHQRTEGQWNPIMFGGNAVWMQMYDATPSNPDGQEMEFIGQIAAGDLTGGVAGMSLYLFYCPKHNIVTQVAQM
jgi:hypothetical protein